MTRSVGYASDDVGWQYQRSSHRFHEGTLIKQVVSLLKINGSYICHKYDIAESWPVDGA